MYEAINCSKCTKRNNIKDFFNCASEITKYSRDYINFYIHVSQLCKLYPKLLYAGVSTNDLKKYLSYMSAEMEKEKQFWSIEADGTVSA